MGLREQADKKKEKIKNEDTLPFKEDLARAANSWMLTAFLESAGDFPDFGIISLSSNIPCKKRKENR